MSNPSRTSSMDTLSSDSSPSLTKQMSMDESELSFEDMLKELQDKPQKNQESKTTTSLTSPRPPAAAETNSPHSTTPTKSSPNVTDNANGDDEELSFEDILKELAERKEREREAKRQQEAAVAAQKKTLTKSRSTFVLPVKLPSLLRPKSSSNIRVPPPAATKKAEEKQQPTKPVQQYEQAPKSTPTSSNNASPVQTPLSSPTMPSTPTMQPISLNQKSKSESNIPANALMLLQQEKRPSSFQTNPTEVVEKGGQTTLFADDDDDDGVSFEDFLKELALKKENSPSTPKSTSNNKTATPATKQDASNNSKSNSIPTLSLRDVLTSEKYRKYFKMHIEKERSVENIMFYEDVEKYKALKLKPRQKKAKEIIEKYLLPDSLQGININRVLANNILRRIEYEGAVADLFDPIVLELEATVLSDSYWRFQPSKLYLEAIKAKQ